MNREAWQRAGHQGYDIEIGRYAEADSRKHEVLCWKDPASSLSVSYVRAANGDYYRLRLGSILIVDILPDRRVVASPQCDVAKSTIEHFMEDQILPRVSAQAGHFVVHAGAVGLGEAAILLLGPSGRGKSTLASSFHQSGSALIGDDAMIVSAFDSKYHVEPVYRSLRLLPDSIAALVPAGTITSDVVESFSKQRIDVAVPAGEGSDSLPIRAVFALGMPTDSDRIALAPMTPANACMALVESCFALDPSDTSRARERLSYASSLARAVPTFEIAYPRKYSQLPKVRQAILEQVAALEPA